MSQSFVQTPALGILSKVWINVAVFLAAPVSVACRACNSANQCDANASSCCWCVLVHAAADRTNTSSACWVHCFFNTLLGPNATENLNATGAMSVAEAVQAWDRPFQSDSAEEGGCPAI